MADNKPPSNNKKVGSFSKIVVGSGRVTLSKGGMKVGVPQYKEEGRSRAFRSKLDEKIFQIPSLKNIKAPDIFKSYMKNIAQKIYQPTTSYEILRAFSNIDVTAEKVADFLKANPYYQFHFLKVIESKGMREELPSLDAAVVLLGMQNSRNLIVALQLMRSVKGTHPETEKEGNLKISPNEVIPFALKTEELLISKKIEYADMGYAAGLFIDILTLITNETSQDKNRVLALIDEVYSHGLRTAQIGAELVRYIPDFSYSKYLFSTCLIHDIGKIILALLDSEYFSFCDILSKKELNRGMRHFAENQRFGVDHAFLAGVSCYYFRMFRPIEKAVLFHHDPYLLKNEKKGLYLLASLVSLSTNIARHFRKPENATDAILSQWKGPELREFRFFDSKNLVGIWKKLESIGK